MDTIKPANSTHDASSSNKTTTTPSHKLRFGVKLQFMVAHPRFSDQSPPKDNDEDRWPPASQTQDSEDYDRSGFAPKRCIYEVCDVLSRSDVPVACDYPRHPRIGDPLSHRLGQDQSSVLPVEYGRYIRTWNSSRAAQGLGHSRYGYWYVKHELGVDQLVRPLLGRNTPVGYSWFCIELCSPVISNEAELRNDLPTLATLLEDLQQNVKIWLNSYCGLRIHVSPCEPWTLDTITAKKAAAIVSLIEKPLLYRMCHPHRLQMALSPLINTHSRIARGGWEHTLEDEESKRIVRYLEQHRRRRRISYLRETDGNDAVFRILYRILTQVSSASLKGGLLQPNNSRCCLAISNSLTSLEFRFAEGSFDHDFIMLWFSLARRVMEIAMAPEREYLEQLCCLYDLATDHREIGWINWLCVIGLEDKGEYVKRLVHGYKSAGGLDKPKILEA